MLVFLAGFRKSWIPAIFFLVLFLVFFIHPVMSPQHYPPIPISFSWGKVQIFGIMYLVEFLAGVRFRRFLFPIIIPGTGII